MEINSNSSVGVTPMALLGEVVSAGGCVHPIRVSGTVLNGATGEFRSSQLKLACKDRRAVLCPSCAALYQGDAWILVSVGLIGGKGVDAEVGQHRKVFVTLTAPSFGAVHRSVAGRQCRTVPGRCSHGRPLSCSAFHDSADPLVGAPICSLCFDYRGAVLWNAQVTRLWNRTTQELLRQIGMCVGRSRDEVREDVRLSYVKVAEFQRRGLVHLHVIIRADGRGDETMPAPPWLDASVLMVSARKTIRTVSWLGADGKSVSWGSQFDVAVLGQDGQDGQDPHKIASYLAKYSVKSTSDSAALARRFRSRQEVKRANLTDHERRLVETAWVLDRQSELRHLKLRTHAHTFGYRGQLLTKSRHYSTTFGALREVRAKYMSKDTSPDPLISSFSYAGRGYDHERASELARVLAEMRAALRREEKQRRVDAAEVAR